MGMGVVTSLGHYVLYSNLLEGVMQDRTRPVTLLGPVPHLRFHLRATVQSLSLQPWDPLWTQSLRKRRFLCSKASSLPCRAMATREAKEKEKGNDHVVTGKKVTEFTSNVSEKNQTEIVQTEEENQEYVQQTLAKHGFKFAHIRRDLAAATRIMDERLDDATRKMDERLDDATRMLCSFLQYSQINSQGYQALTAANKARHVLREAVPVGALLLMDVADPTPKVSARAPLLSFVGGGDQATPSSCRQAGTSPFIGLPTREKMKTPCPTMGAPPTLGLPGAQGEVTLSVGGGVRNVADCSAFSKRQNLVAPPSDRPPPVAPPPSAERGPRESRPPPPITHHHYGWGAVGAPSSAAGFPSLPHAERGNSSPTARLLSSGSTGRAGLSRDRATAAAPASHRLLIGVSRRLIGVSCRRPTVAHIAAARLLLTSAARLLLTSPPVCSSPHFAARLLQPAVARHCCPLSLHPARRRILVAHHLSPVRSASHRRFLRSAVAVVLRSAAHRRRSALCRSPSPAPCRSPSPLLCALPHACTLSPAPCRSLSSAARRLRSLPPIARCLCLPPPLCCSLPPIVASSSVICEANTSSFVSSGEMKSSPFSSIISKMNGGNYEMWAMQVKRTLIAHDKEHLILEPEPVQKTLYESAKNQMLTSPSIPPIDEAYSRLSRILISAVTVPDTTSAMLATRGRGGPFFARGRGGRGRGNAPTRPVCQFCNRIGHTIDKCWQKHGRPVFANQTVSTDSLEQPKPQSSELRVDDILSQLRNLIGDRAHQVPDPPTSTVQSRSHHYRRLHHRGVRPARGHLLLSRTDLVCQPRMTSFGVHIQQDQLTIDTGAPQSIRIAPPVMGPVFVQFFFDYYQVEEQHRVPLAATRLRGLAQTWWFELQRSYERRSQRPVQAWGEMQRLMQTKFVPSDHAERAYKEYINLRQGLRSVADYTAEFHRLSLRIQIVETERQQVTRMTLSTLMVMT
ncbi:hypothetical protein EJ110_NYTH53266 [Nymphaea thermarum]|nr:hypothetical protein EJ110_NYTH53266 [Nymphaea thermarum]